MTACSPHGRIRRPSRRIELVPGRRKLSIPRRPEAAGENRVGGSLVTEAPMGYGWEGEKVRLVPLDKEKHLANALTWMNDTEVTTWTSDRRLPITRLWEEEFFDKAMRGDGGRLDFAVETLAGDHVGFTGFHNDRPSPRCRHDGRARRPQGAVAEGLGTDIVRVRTRYAFEVWACGCCFPRRSTATSRRSACSARRLPRGRPHPAALLQARRLPRRAAVRARAPVNAP